MKSNDHLVIHDLAILAVASVSGVTTHLATGSAPTGVLAMGTVLTLGGLVMTVGPLRRLVNRSALAVAKSAR